MSFADTAHRMTSAATAWVHRTMADSMIGDSAVDLDPDGDYKSLAETAIISSVILREGVCGAAQAQQAREMLDFAWSQLRHGDLLYERQLRYPLGIDPMETYAHFVRCGLRHARLDELLAHVHRLRLGETLEMVPDRRLAVANAARIIGLPAHSGMADLAAGTWLGATTEPWAIDWMTAYQMTHTVFHLTDWGARPEGMPPPLRDYLRNWLPVWLDVWSEIAQWDLVGELLIVDSCLDEPVCPESAWDLLAAQQRPDGSMPAEGAGSPDAEYKHVHHPTVVAAVAGTLGLSRRLRVAA